MNRLLWSQPARRDLFGILDYYEGIDVDLAMRLTQAVEEEPLRLLDLPRLGSPVGRGGIRKWRVRRTPFLLYYSVRGDVVEIRRVFHHAMDRK